MRRTASPLRSLLAATTALGMLLLASGLDAPRTSWGDLPVGARPTAQNVPGGPIYVVLTALVDDGRTPAAEAEALAWLMDRLDHHGVQRLSVSMSPVGLTALDETAPDTLDRLAARRPAIGLHGRPPQSHGEGALDWQLWAYDPVRRAFDRNRTGGALRLLLRAGIAPADGGADLGDLLRRRQTRSPEDEDLERLDIRLPSEPELFAPPARIVAAGLGLPDRKPDAPTQSRDVQAWQDAEAAVSRHAAGEGAIAHEAEAAALDDLARMASLAALSGIDLPSVPGVSDFVHGVPRVAARPWRRASPADHAGLQAAIEEDASLARADLGAACAGLARALDARGALHTELTRRLAEVPIDQSVVLGLAWPLLLEHRTSPWRPSADSARTPADRARVRASLDHVLAALAAEPRVRFVAPGQATQWRPENGGAALSNRVFALEPSAILGAVSPAEVEVLHRRARIEDLRRR
jgi:hypothetical protein